MFPTPEKSPSVLTTCGKCHEGQRVNKGVEPSVDTSAKEPSLWDRVRSDVRGQTTTPTAKPATRMRRQDVCTPGSLAESILALLAEHGHNFRQLPVNESISVVVTLPAESQPTGDKPKAEQTNPVRAAKQLFDLAELHLKQGKVSEASRTIADVIKRLGHDPIQFPDGMTRDGLRQQLDEAKQLLRSAYNLQAQTLLGLGQVAEARAAIDKAQTAEVTAHFKEGSVETRPPTTLPRKLVVTVSKKLLDQVHAKQIDLEQFRKAAEVEGVSLPSKK
jgi:hypothetical protein